LNLDALFIYDPTPHAVAALFDPTLCFLNKNCLFKFEISILSSSVTVTYPYAPLPQPIRANILIYSQPKAPAPTINILEFYNYFNV